MCVRRFTKVSGSGIFFGLLLSFSAKIRGDAALSTRRSECGEMTHFLRLLRLLWFQSMAELYQLNFHAGLHHPARYVPQIAIFTR